ncbi:MAG: hypothetical protein GWN99_18190 [Gemmatimonadetes bacterium]|uniref:Uncharacterized protein n=1 Tax=Candidatus Kutchimonas denitrificans TaxID=3056748 RepID=A0AAE4Z765_9BACT|nr:hypothetical protein [Gemmatimonadota bacterium]NIR73977.1 hypothetical protein [Candidatus Kutchimonas denitrificans]NIS02966.1 hypothetical protein [Gemmatimonadota bacterium]NIT68683.1 hypothetical protein [Gemmatimonadota bacterium]NIU53264.1 hypothetical protein [Gemmatimonadota bacterium]
MKLSIRAVSLAFGIVWGAAVLLVGLAHLIWPGYGSAFLALLESIYPGYDVGGFGSVIVGTLYALVDGAVGGAVFAWLYNRLAR